MQHRSSFAAPHLLPAAFAIRDRALQVACDSVHKNGGDVSVLVCGDWAAVREFSNVHQWPPSDLYGDLLPVIRGVDLALVNLECPLGGEEPLIKDGPAFRVDPASAAALRDTGFQIATLANNHVYDQRQEGLDATLTACRQAGIRTVGAGRDLAQAMAPVFFDIGDFKLGVLALADCEEGMAGRAVGGAAPINDMHVLDRCRAAREQCDVLLVIAHGGREYTPYPPPYWYERLLAIADAGVDAVIAHHPHVPQGMAFVARERTRAPVPIIFSTGNFVFPPRPATNIASVFMSLGYMVELSIASSGVVSVRLHPYRIDLEHGLRLLPVDRMPDFRTFMESLSEPLADADQVDDWFNVAADYFWDAHWCERVRGLTAKLCADDFDGLRHGRSHFRSAAHATFIDCTISRKLHGAFGSGDADKAAQLRQWFAGAWPIRWI